MWGGLAPPAPLSSRKDLSSLGVWGPACLWLCDLGQQPAPVTHFLHLYNETIGLDVLEGSFQHSESTVSPPLALTPPTPGRLHCPLCHLILLEGCVYGEWREVVREDLASPVVAVEVGGPMARALSHLVVLEWRGAWRRKGRCLVVGQVC